MAYNHGHRRASNYGEGAVNFLLEISNRVGEQVEKVARISCCSFRIFAQSFATRNEESPKHTHIEKV